MCIVYQILSLIYLECDKTRDNAVSEHCLCARHPRQLCWHFVQKVVRFVYNLMPQSNYLRFEGEDEDVLSVSDDMCPSDGEQDDTDSLINPYSSDSSPRITHKPYDSVGGGHLVGGQRPMLPEMPRELELRPTTNTITNCTTGGPNQQNFITVCARKDLKLGTIFGPYQGKIRKDPIATTFNWKVSPNNFSALAGDRMDSTIASNLCDR